MTAMIDTAITELAPIVGVRRACRGGRCRRRPTGIAATARPRQLLDRPRASPRSLER